jgi:small GTP-binding protein
MSKQKHKRKRSQPDPELEFLLEQEEPEVPTFTEIGGSPVPGFILRHVLRGPARWTGRIAWSPDGAYLASPSDETVWVWRARSRAFVQTLRGCTSTIYSVAWSPDGRLIASGSEDMTICLWDVASGKLLRTLEGHTESVWSVAWSPDSRLIASGSGDMTIRLWDVASSQHLQTLEGHTHQVTSVAWSPDGRLIASGSRDMTIRLWDVASSQHLQTLEGHIGYVMSVVWSPNGQLIASASPDRTIRLWDSRGEKALRVLEGHYTLPSSLSFAANGHWLASRDQGSASHDTVRLWRCDTWTCVAVLQEPASPYWPPSLAFHPHLPVLATLGENDRIIRIWELDETLLLSQEQKSVNYTTAKLVLVGDSGVGKTGLGWRLAHGEFKEHSSTHGQQFWPITQLGLKRKDGTECEAVLWDLAGQHVYRQIHSIFLDNVAAALVLFDPSNRQEPLKGVQFWLEQLKGKGQLPPTVLVGARVDRGAPALSQQELDQFCQRYGIRGGYISTSASSGEGLAALLEKLKAQIPWGEMTATVTTITFKRIKDYVLALKEKPDGEGVLVSPKELRAQLEAAESLSRTVEKSAADGGQQTASWVSRIMSVFKPTQEAAASEPWTFTDAEMMTAVGHLETHGYVAVLRSSAGEQHILLTADLLVNLAASIMMRADKNPRELGAVSETELLQGTSLFDELAGLSQTESRILLDAAILRFLEHNVCFRETFGSDTLLIFPSLIKQKRPLKDDLPATDDISYVVRGRVENLYASLVVLLGYTPSFTRINQWQNQAQYEMGEGEICGFRLIEDREGEIELVLYYGERMPASGRAKFQELFEQFLYQRDVEVTRFPPVVCPTGHRQKRDAVMEAVRERLPSLYCYKCGKQADLPNFDQPQTIGIHASPWLQREEAAARLRSAYEVHLTKIKGYRRGWATPRCYVSHLPAQTAWAEKLVQDLRDAGVYVVEQAAQVQSDDFVIVLDTPAFQKAFNTPALAADAPLIQARFGNKRQLFSLALTGQASAHEFEDCKPGSFCDQTHYPVSLFDLVLCLYAIPLAHAGFAPLRQALHAQWEQTLARKQGADATSALKLFISYSHKDEAFKDELVTMLAGLQRRGLLDAWHDRRIEAGDEWYKSIQDAMDDCDLSLLLVSPDYLASRFIQAEEQPKLLQRRQEMQLRVIPIIVRPCKWTSEPVLKDLQALPKDGKAVIKFPKATGARDQVWADIATVIEQRANTS